MGCNSSRRRRGDECCPSPCLPVYEIPCPRRRRCCGRNRCAPPCEPECYPQTDCCPPRRRCCRKERCPSPCTSSCPATPPLIPLHLIPTQILNSHQQSISPIYEQNFYPDQFLIPQTNGCC